MPRDLVERAMAGDHDAFSELARASIGRLYATARLILRDDGRAEDATQEALVGRCQRRVTDLVRSPRGSVP
jgi:DNA-directed RNA polymerase specialized sigma24 family protein